MATASDIAFVAIAGAAAAGIAVWMSSDFGGPQELPTNIVSIQAVAPEEPVYDGKCGDGRIDCGPSPARVAAEKVAR